MNSLCKIYTKVELPIDLQGENAKESAKNASPNAKYLNFQLQIEIVILSPNG